MGLFDFFRKGNDFSDADKAKLDGIDPSKYVSIDQYNELRNLVTQLIEFMPDHIDTSQFALKSQIPSMPDMRLYALKSELPDTVKYIENSNTTSKIKKIRISIEDKATFDQKSNPADNIAHTI